MTLATGTRPDRYGIRSQLGGGGMGGVYLAEGTEAMAVLKLNATIGRRDDRAVKRFDWRAMAGSRPPLNGG